MSLKQSRGTGQIDRLNVPQPSPLDPSSNPTNSTPTSAQPSSGISAFFANLFPFWKGSHSYTAISNTSTPQSQPKRRTKRTAKRKGKTISLSSVSSSSIRPSNASNSSWSSRNSSPTTSLIDPSHSRASTQRGYIIASTGKSQLTTGNLGFTVLLTGGVPTTTSPAAEDTEIQVDLDCDSEDSTGTEFEGYSEAGSERGLLDSHRQIVLIMDPPNRDDSLHNPINMPVPHLNTSTGTPTRLAAITNLQISASPNATPTSLPNSVVTPRGTAAPYFTINGGDENISPISPISPTISTSLLCPTANIAGVFLPSLHVTPELLISHPTESGPSISPMVHVQSPPSQTQQQKDNAVSNPLPPVTPVTTEEFISIVNEVRLAIAQGIYPDRIRQGSSGSYFCKNRQGQIVGVFKPKNEEPYGKLNPKWTKWLHKNLFPCCFGRSCLIPNLGYISEAAASYVDRALGLNIVPRTEIVELASPTFYYSKADRKAAKRGKRPLPPKVGSFQLFLNGYKDASAFFREGYDRIGVLTQNQGGGSNGTNAPENDVTRHRGSIGPNLHPLGWTQRMQMEFRWGFERLSILDYLIRNTDRGMDNWMVRQRAEKPLVPDQKEQQQVAVQLVSIDNTEQQSGLQQSHTSPTMSTTASGTTSSNNTKIFDNTPATPTISVAAIDNGLAFPFKHPDRWRSYPYGWAPLAASRIPYSTSTQELLLPLLTNADWWQNLFNILEALMRVDEGFDESMWRATKAVIRGQGYNLIEVLRRSMTGDGTPLALVQRPVVSVYEDEESDEESSEDKEHEMTPEDGFHRVAVGVSGGVVLGGTPETPHSHTRFGLDDHRSIRSGIKTIRRTAKRYKRRFERLAKRPWFTWC